MKTTIVKQSAVLFAIACVFCSRAFADTFTVTNTNDTGAGSLRQGIADANNHAGTDMISFNIPTPGLPTLHAGTSAAADHRSGGDRRLHAVLHTAVRKPQYQSAWHG